MRSFALLVVLHLSMLSRLVGQEPVGLDEAPSGTNWIADQVSKRYYPIDCEAARTVPRRDRLYYATEAAVRQDSFIRTTVCGADEPPRLQDAARLQDASPPAAPAPRVPAQAALVEPENKHVRKGFWFSGGLGVGSLGCDDCSGRESGLSGGLGIGGSVSQKVLLGAGTTGWTKSEGGVDLTVGTLVALIRFYPSATGGFFLIGGLGLGSIRAEVSGFGSDSETGAGALLGLGYDIRVGQNVSLTPFWNGFAARTSNADANVGQLGVSVTLH